MNKRDRIYMLPTDIIDVYDSHEVTLLQISEYLEDNPYCFIVIQKKCKDMFADENLHWFLLDESDTPLYFHFDGKLVKVYDLVGEMNPIYTCHKVWDAIKFCELYAKESKHISVMDFTSNWYMNCVSQDATVKQRKYIKFLSGKEYLGKISLDKAHAGMLIKALIWAKKWKAFNT